VIESNFFECDDLIGLLITCFIDDAIGSLSNFIDSLKFIIIGDDSVMLLIWMHVIS